MAPAAALLLTPKLMLVYILAVPIAVQAESNILSSGCPRGQVVDLLRRRCTTCPSGTVKQPNVSGNPRAACISPRKACGSSEVAAKGSCVPCPEQQVPADGKSCKRCADGFQKIPAGAFKTASCQRVTTPTTDTTKAPNTTQTTNSTELGAANTTAATNATTSANTTVAVNATASANTSAASNTATAANTTAADSTTASTSAGNVNATANATVTANSTATTNTSRDAANAPTLQFDGLQLSSRPAHSMAYSGWGGSYLMVGEDDGSISVYNPKPFADQPPLAPLERRLTGRHTQAVAALDFSDERGGWTLLASASVPTSSIGATPLPLPDFGPVTKNVVTLWDVKAGDWMSGLPCVVTQRQMTAAALAFAPDGYGQSLGAKGLLAVACDQVMLWNASTSFVFERAPDVYKYILLPEGIFARAVAFSYRDGGRFLAVGDSTGSIRLFDMERLLKEATEFIMIAYDPPELLIKAHSQPVTSLQYIDSMEGPITIISAGEDGRVAMWEVATGKLVWERQLLEGGAVNSVAMTFRRYPEVPRKVMAVGANGLRQVLNATTGAAIPAQYGAPPVSGDVMCIATTQYDQFSVAAERGSWLYVPGTGMDLAKKTFGPPPNQGNDEDTHDAPTNNCDWITGKGCGHDSDFVPPEDPFQRPCVGSTCFDVGPLPDWGTWTDIDYGGGWGGRRSLARMLKGATRLPKGRIQGVRKAVAGLQAQVRRRG